MGEKKTNDLLCSFNPNMNSVGMEGRKLTQFLFSVMILTIINHSGTKRGTKPVPKSRKRLGKRLGVNENGARCRLQLLQYYLE